MASITLKGNPFNTSGELPAVGTAAPDFDLVGADLAGKTLADYPGWRVLNIFPSIDTPVCAASLRTFNEKAAGREGVTVLNISKDLPFATKRFCAAEGIEGAETLSCFRSDFARSYGVEIVDGPLTGLCARSVVVVDGSGNVAYTELVPEIGQEPDYDAALAALDAAASA
jgi:thiol peroxidase